MILIMQSDAENLIVLKSTKRAKAAPLGVPIMD
jgi:hypothetical protein